MTAGQSEAGRQNVAHGSVTLRSAVQMDSRRAFLLLLLLPTKLLTSLCPPAGPPANPVDVDACLVGGGVTCRLTKPPLVCASPLTGTAVYA